MTPTRLRALAARVATAACDGCQFQDGRDWRRADDVFDPSTGIVLPPHGRCGWTRCQAPREVRCAVRELQEGVRR